MGWAGPSLRANVILGTTAPVGHTRPLRKVLTVPAALAQLAAGVLADLRERQLAILAHSTISQAPQGQLTVWLVTLVSIATAQPTLILLVNVLLDTIALSNSMLFWTDGVARRTARIK